MTKNLPNQKNNFFKLHKEQALKDIKNSIEEWSNFQEKNFFYQIFSQHKKSKHWEASNLMLNLFHVHLRWSKNIVRSQTNIKKREVLNVLLTMKDFYSKISIVKPDLSHPDIIECFNLTAKENNLKQKTIKFKDKIEINFFDPFNNILGKEMEIIEQKYHREKKIALKKIQYAFDFLDQIDNKLSKFDIRELEEPEILICNEANSIYELKFLWCGQQLESYKNLKKKEIIEKLNEIKKTINYFNILRPNLSDVLINRMYKCLINDNKRFFHVQSIKIKNDLIKKKFRKLLTFLKCKLKKKKYFNL